MHLLTYSYNDFHSSADNIDVNFRERDSRVNCWKHPYFKTFWQEVADTVSHFISFDMSPEPLLWVSSDSIWNLTSQPPPRLYYTSYCLHEKESSFFPWKQVFSVCTNTALLLKRVEWMTSKMCFNTRKKRELEVWLLRVRRSWIKFFIQQGLLSFPPPPSFFAERI